MSWTHKNVGGSLGDVFSAGFVATCALAAHLDTLLLIHPLQHLRGQVPHAHQIVCGRREGEHPAHCSVSIRSLRTVYSTCNNRARNNFCGGTEGRPISEYMVANRPDRCSNTLSQIRRMARSG